MQTHRFAFLTAVIASAMVGILTGCSANFVSGPVQDEHVPIGNIHGMVHGGQAPVTGAAIYLYQASTSGWGTAATSLICNSSLMTGSCPAGVYEDGSGNYYVKTDGQGNFALSGDYVCTSGSQVYMVAVGGNPGVGLVTTTATFSASAYTVTVANAAGITVGENIIGTGVNGTVTGIAGTTITLSQQNTSSGSNVTVTFSNVNNTAIVQMAALGQCPTGTNANMASQVPYLVINEVTTVAFAYSVGGFATTPYNVSTDAGGTTALANAFANASNIVNLQWGQAPANPNGNPTNGTNPQAKIYSLANLLATCVNTSSNTSTNCTNLFKYATTSSGTQATDEASAIFNIVHNQAQNVSNLWNLTSSTTPFTPALTSQPIDWTLPVIYNNVLSKYGTSNGTTIDSGPFNVAADASGDMWIGDEVKGVVQVTPLGAFSYHTTDNNGATFGEVKGVAVTSSGTIWVSDAVNNKMTILSNAGAATYTSKNGDGGIDGPAGIAFDSSGNAYVANDTGNNLSIFNPNGSAQKGVAYTFSGAGLDGPAWVEVDSLGDAFTPSQQSTELGGLAYGVNKGSVTSISDAYALAIDKSNFLWMPNNSNTGPWFIYKISCPQTTNGGGQVNGVSCALQGSVTNLGGMNIPDRIALDGGGTLWIANQGAETVSGYNITSGSWLALRGFSTSATDDCLDAVPDISGNVWTANKDGSVIELLGLGTPTKSPKNPGNYQAKP